MVAYIVEQPTFADVPPAPARPQRAPRVLLVDGDVSHTHEVERLLRGCGWSVRRATTWATAMAPIAGDRVDLVLLELAMPGFDGFALAEEIRQRSTLPIMVVSRLAAERDKVRALDGGADDFITKPVGGEELLARMRAVLRRVTPADEAVDVIEIGALTVRVSQRQVLRHGQPVRLTPTEFDLLALLARNAGKVLARTTLLQRVWGSSYRDAHDYLWAYIRRLRLKLEDDPHRPRYLLSEAGAGYRFCAPAAEA